MRYFMDSEFHEYKKQPKVLGFNVGKQVGTIDLISIGIVSEDNREYYAISKDFNLKKAWNAWQPKEHSLPMGTIKEYWLRENVLKPIFKELWSKDESLLRLIVSEEEFEEVWKIKPRACRGWFRMLIKKYGKTNKQIANDIKEFVYVNCFKNNKGNVIQVESKKQWLYGKPEFYAYYADYDWVVFCWLFGRMIDLPKGFPMYCKDLKQTSDEIYAIELLEAKEEFEIKGIKGCFLEKLSQHPDYPRQTNEHNALDDAKWNFRLFKFLEEIR